LRRSLEVRSLNFFQGLPHVLAARGNLFRDFVMSLVPLPRNRKQRIAELARLFSFVF
jgi:hypothetical protein